MDPRLPQIVTLATLLGVQLIVFDFAPSPLQATVSVTAAISLQAILCRLLGARFDWRSPLITGLSLALLLRSHDVATWVMASCLAIGGKFLFSYRGKHVFNPACFGIVVLLLLSDRVWISPSQWGSTLWLGFLVMALGGLVLSNVQRLDIALAFFASYGGLLLARCLILGDPLTIPAHQMQSGALLIFGLFMITDPRSTPDSRSARVAFAVAVACLAHWLQFHAQLREGLFFALAIVSLASPLLDRWRPQARFHWASLQER